VSRVMVHLFSRLTRLISRVSRFTSPIPETGSPPPPLTEQDPSIKSKSMREPTREIIYEARSLRDDVDAWIESLQLATLEHERVQVGNRAYAYAMKVGLSSSSVLSGHPKPRRQICSGRSTKLIIRSYC